MEAAKKEAKGVETFKNFVGRTCVFLDMIESRYKNKNVLVVTHAANARIFNWYYLGKPKDYDFIKTVGDKGGLMLFGRDIQKQINYCK